MITELLKPIGRFEAFASRTHNAALAAALKTNFTALDETPDGEVIGAMETLMTAMRGAVASVTTVPTATLDALDDAIDSLEPMLGSPRSQIVDRAGANEELERERRAARLVLENQHDKILRSFEHADPATPVLQRQRELFDRWEPARRIVDAPDFLGRRRAALGDDADALSPRPLQGVGKG